MSKYFAISSKTFAQAMNLIGFSYYIFKDADGSVTYSFENTELFQEGYKEMCELRKKYRNKLIK